MCLILCADCFVKFLPQAISTIQLWSRSWQFCDRVLPFPARRRAWRATWIGNFIARTALDVLPLFAVDSASYFHAIYKVHGTKYDWCFSVCCLFSICLFVWFPFAGGPHLLPRKEKQRTDGYHTTQNGRQLICGIFPFNSFFWQKIFCVVYVFLTNTSWLFSPFWNRSKTGNMTFLARQSEGWVCPRRFYPSSCLTQSLCLRRLWRQDLRSWPCPEKKTECHRGSPWNWERKLCAAKEPEDVLPWSLPSDEL